VIIWSLPLVIFPGGNDSRSCRSPDQLSLDVRPTGQETPVPANVHCQVTRNPQTPTTLTVFPQSLYMSSSSEVRTITGLTARRAVAATTASMAYL
jgi:hypothetical protein